MTGGAISMDGIEDLKFETNETDLAEVLGVSINELRTLRAGAPEGRAWVRKGRAVFWSQEGVDGLRCSLGGVALEKKEGAALRVLWVKLRVRNPKMLIAVATAEEVRGADAGRYRVRVRDASRFAVGQCLEGCRHVQADLYAFEGRVPRSRKLVRMPEKKEGGAL